MNLHWTKKYSLFCLLALFYYSLMRLEFLIWNFSQFRQTHFQQFALAFLQGLRFDGVSILLISLPLFLLVLIFDTVPQFKNLLRERAWTAASIFILVAHFFLMSLSLVDTEFVNFTGKRFSLETLFILRETQGKMGNFLLSYWHLWIINATIVFSFMYFGWKILNPTATDFVLKISRAFASFSYSTFKRKFPKDVSAKLKWPSSVNSILASQLSVILITAVYNLTMIGFFVVGARGGLQKKPLNFVDAKIFESSLMNQMVLNSAFTMIKSAGKSKLPHYRFFESSEELEKALHIFSENPKPVDQKKLREMPGFSNSEEKKGATKDLRVNPLQSFSQLQKPNIVLIILESFSIEYMGLDERKSYTPFLDSLARKSLFFKNSFADGRRSIEGVGAILAGIPAWMEEPFISSEFATNQILGLGSWLKNRGYSTSFFHGGMNGTMYFDSFAKSTGFDQYFGFNEYPDKSDFDGTWGVYDEPFLQFMISKLNNFEQPFATSVFTLSSHQPYKIPEKYKTKFVGGPIEILASIEYADHALKLFFEEAEKQSWFKNTLFILTADHTGRPVSKDFDHDIGYYQIPILFYSPGGGLKPEVSPKSFTQIDIIPTLQGLFGESNYSTQFGKNALLTSERPIILSLGETYLVVDSQFVLTWSQIEGSKLFARAPWPQKKPVENQALLLKYENFLKANLQKFSIGLYDNKLYFPAK